ncbi:MAG TPA: ribosomal protein S18-alanine N-acetyltransferase [Psychrobacter sp.]|uniref:ribosomal protein S18-alanine N-acetyltransferase n=1 Tax=Psychrobacter sp. TaxID=56811 RepID=UPI002C3638D0|nr:ribosomal protein S18-alanine N-acetyltransferase [Psychrobacter sp.]HSP84260.1 ribosomal protein S18-alanine N-acetyltransferase [Psychrobacter sp.]
MFSIKMLINEPDKRAEMLEAVAAIEAMVQLQEPWSYKTINDFLQQDSIKLMLMTDTNNDEVVGYCLYQVLFEQAEIFRIGTHPNYQRQGIASQIFARLNEELKNQQVEALLLEVRADNIAAIALYEQQGFTIIHSRKGYYQVGLQSAIDALIMQHIYR